MKGVELQRQSEEMNRKAVALRRVVRDGIGGEKPGLAVAQERNAMQREV